MKAKDYNKSTKEGFTWRLLLMAQQPCVEFKPKVVLTIK